MHRPIKKCRLGEHKNAEDADAGGSGSLIEQTGTNSGGSSLSLPTETNNSASNSSTLSIGNCYEVFLSFRGPDTREGFTDHLYNGLVDAGIRAFRDDEELREGEEIGPDLSAAIKYSKILIPILSVNYGSSKWCLDELVQMMECKNDGTGTVVLPIFYKVEPADVRYQKGSFGDAFRTRESSMHERGFDPTILEKWKQALFEVSSLKGFNADGYEGQLVKSIVRGVLLELNKKFELILPENLVGIDSHVKKVMEFANSNSHNPIFVGIHGMGGIGKTTLAKTIYNKLSNQFEDRSFVADIRESCKRNGLEYLQNQLISDVLKQNYKVSNRDEGISYISSRFKGKKVLILLDDADDDDQLKALAGNRNWFYSGSIIIITTRNKSILNNAKVDYNYELEEMDKDTSSILFSRHAFRKDAPPIEFEAFTRDVVSATGGLPLSLEVFGSFLRDKRPNIWIDTIKKLKIVPHKKVQEKLRISYDALEYGQQQIFLDIACFFIGTDGKIAPYMWDACGFFPDEGIEVLRSMSLIKVGDDNEFRMHDQLRDLGRLIVCEGNENKPQNYSRLWDPKEAWAMLEENEGTKYIEAISLRKYQGGDILKGEQFKKSRNLRFLEAIGVHFSGDFKNIVKKLKWLKWQHCPLAFEANNFHVKDLVVLDMASSLISDEWRGWSSIMMAEKLKYLDLRNCMHLEKTSFLSTFENLEVLILGDCWEIKQIDSSIGNMKSLVRLDLTGCSRLRGLPAEVGKLKALKELILTRSGIEQLPDSIGDLQNLEFLKICLAPIKELPSSIRRLSKLRILDASFCSKLGGEMEESIGNASSGCLDLHSREELPLSAVFPSSLTKLSLTWCSHQAPSLSNLIRLEVLELLRCNFLKCIWEHPSTLLGKTPNTPFKLEYLHISRCNFMKTLDVSQLNRLKILRFTFCEAILEIQGLDKLQCLEMLEIECCDSIGRIDLPKSKDLKILSTQHCRNLVEIQGLDRLEVLKELDIYDCPSIATLDLPNSKDLKILNAQGCKKLVEIQGLDRLESLEEIYISGCASIQRLNLLNSKGLKNLSCRSCKNLFEIQGLNRLEFLNVLNMSGCTSFGKLPDLRCFDTLEKLAINCCDMLHDVQSLERFPSCTSLWIEDYKSLAKFPNLSNFRKLQKFFLLNCHGLREIPGLEESTSLQWITISECSSIEGLPDLSSCTSLTRLVVHNCEKLTELRGLKKLEQLEELDISGCRSLKTTPKLTAEFIGIVGIEFLF